MSNRSDSLKALIDTETLQSRLKYDERILTLWKVHDSSNFCQNLRASSTVFWYDPAFFPPEPST